MLFVPRFSKRLFAFPSRLSRLSSLARVFSARLILSFFFRASFASSPHSVGTCLYHSWPLVVTLTLPIGVSNSFTLTFSWHDSGTSFTRNLPTFCWATRSPHLSSVSFYVLERPCSRSTIFQTFIDTFTNFLNVTLTHFLTSHDVDPYCNQPQD